MEAYDFVMVVERMDESLVVLSLLLGLPVGDVLVSNSKVAGGYLQSRFGKKLGQCKLQVKGNRSLGIEAYIGSPEWKAMQYADEILYRAANASLDRTIEQIGRIRFEAALEEYRQLQQRAREVCGPTWGTGCTVDGQQFLEPCYERDFGCGYQCIDRLLDQ